jgi:hypothetical protein
MEEHSKIMTINKQGKEPNHAGLLDSDVPASRTVKNAYCLSHLAYCIPLEFQN